MVKHIGKKSKGLNPILRELCNGDFMIRFLNVYNLSRNPEVYLKAYQSTGGMAQILKITPTVATDNLADLLDRKDRLVLPVSDFGISLCRKDAPNGDQTYDLDVLSQKRIMTYGETFEGCQEGYSQIAQVFQQYGWTVELDSEKRD